ncbi:MAG: Uma2 family endonuclease [Prosthecobacter sp.]|uniref:Uma2 family endonuclease n=1 Tax=Prosthecobacter sp. TaxID=1965333 RepID=UPI0039044B75
MAALLAIPHIKDTRAFHLKRWAEVYADPELHRYPGRVETNRFGHILMMPPPGFPHSSRQSEIMFQLRTQLPGGRSLTECAVLTTDGVKGVDVAWISAGRIKRGLKGEVLTIAPEICVEVISPKNTRQELETKRDLYFEAGADEVWFCDKQGALHFFLKDSADTEVKASGLCPSMPKRIKA